MVVGGYQDFARGLIAGGVLSDPWLEGEPRFSLDPVVLPPARVAALYEAAEAVARAHAELAGLCAEAPELLDRLGLSPAQRLLWLASAPHWHVLARADVFWTAAGPVVCELNSDTPSGEAEAVLLNAYAAARSPGLADLNAGLGDRFCDAVAACAGALGTAGPLALALVYPTDLTEDLSMIALYARWFRQRGWRVASGSPFNLRACAGGRVGLFDLPCDVVIRHYKTDWWTERLAVWRDDAPFADPAPLVEPLRVLLAATLSGAAAVVNPLGAVVTQNKRALALLWEERHRLGPGARRAVERYLPYTARLETLPVATLRARRAEWVLKSDYGCEGD